MDDLINRQETIDALIDRFADEDCPNIESFVYWDHGKVIDTIKKVPTAQSEIVRCHQCIHWDRDTVRRNSNDAGWWNEAICKRYSDEIWDSWKDADWYCADAERRTDG